jgi:large subunit ribosomal protein L10
MLRKNVKKKEELVGVLSDRFQTVNAAIVSHYAGTTVEQMTSLRNNLREHGVEMRIVKNSLAKRAIKDTDLEPLTDHLTGPTALAYCDDDPVALAKALNDFAGENEQFVIQAGVLRGQLLEKAQVVELAKTPSRDVLLGRMVGTLQNPITGFVCVTSGILRKLVYALDAVRREKEKQEG